MKNSCSLVKLSKAGGTSFFFTISSKAEWAHLKVRFNFEKMLRK